MKYFISEFPSHTAHLLEVLFQFCMESNITKFSSILHLILNRSSSLPSVLLEIPPCGFAAFNPQLLQTDAATVKLCEVGLFLRCLIFSSVHIIFYITNLWRYMQFSIRITPMPCWPKSFLMALLSCNP